MADNIQATPRNYIGGLLTDAYKWMQSPERTQQLQGFAGLLGTTGIPQTIERMAYGEPLTNIGRANVPLLKPETADALMTVGPMVGPAARGAGRLAGSAVNEAMVYGRGPLASITPQPMRMDVWHGSPHGPFTNFDSSKIGSGTGSQAYSYGHYLSEAPTLAKEYKRKLGDVSVMLGDTSIDDIISKGGNEAKAAQRLKNDFTNPSIAQHPDDVSNPNFWKETENFYKTANTPESKDVKDLLDNFGPISATTKGYLYKVNLPDESIAKMLDWDKPLKDQTPEIKALAQQYGLTDSDHLGGDLVAAMNGKTPAGAEAMRQAGITGVRYLDEGSRGAGKGTSNFVVFPQNESLLTIKEINDQPIGGLLAP